jgi:hypothetical protein
MVCEKKKVGRSAKVLKKRKYGNHFLNNLNKGDQ